MCGTYKDVYERYLEEAKKLAGGRVLKTDAHNESGIYAISIPIMPELPDGYCIEYDTAVLARTKQNYPMANIISGDIRDIPFRDKFFDSVLDLSTIDHIHPDDVEKVLSEYDRVCKGNLVIVVWTGEMGEPGERSHTSQYYFDKVWFETQLKKFFKIESEEQLIEVNGNILFLYKLIGNSQ